MRKLSFILVFISSIVLAQSPHGSALNLECNVCHSSEGWQIDKSNLKFNHSTTGFELAGQHRTVDCSSCHTTLVFSTAKSDCNFCHTDIHEQTVGLDCAGCHNTNSWVVNNVIQLHESGRFPLLGAHSNAGCQQCHNSSSKLNFEPLGVECIDCHKTNFEKTTNPNHIDAGFSTNCIDCHSVSSFEWGLSNFVHDFFPLTLGHKISNCFDCHSNESFEGLSQNCIDCHQTTFNETKEPNHVDLKFQTTCQDCHTTNPGWTPAEFKEHDTFYELIGAHKTIQNDCQKCHENGYKDTPDQCFDCHSQNFNDTTDPSHVNLNFSKNCLDCHSQSAWTPSTFEHDADYFPIYSGDHKGEWDACSDCHTDQINYQIFTCIDCHEHNSTDTQNEHSDVNGYIYETNACLSCHPQGSAEDGLTVNHANTDFPLTGAHVGWECSKCHVTTAPLSSECFACHEQDFSTGSDPNHQTLNFDLKCEICHSTEPGWQITAFPIHDDFFALTGAHAQIGNDCTKCHDAGYTNTKNLCNDCHNSDYQTATDPNHSSAGFSTDCETCHNSSAWSPSTFDHDNQYFPIYSGEHNNEWNLCSDCHTNSTDITVFSCIDCHEHNRTDMDDEHKDENDYVYASWACYDCHPKGKADDAALREDLKLKTINRKVK